MKRSLLARVSCVALVVVAGALVAGCGGGGSASATAPRPFRIALDWVPNTNHTGIYVARAQGLFAKAGLDLQILPYASTSPTVLVAQGKADVGIGFVPELLVQRTAGVPVKAVAAIIPENQEALVVRADSKFRAAKDLTAAKTYLGFGGPAEVPEMSAVIRAAGGTPNFKMTILDTSAYEALYQGKGDFSDLFLGWEAIEARLRKPPVKLRLFRVRDILGARDGDWPTAIMVASDAAIKDNADVLKRGLAALAQGYEFAAKNPDEAAAILGKADRALARRADLVRESARFLAPTYLGPDGRWGDLDPAKLQGLADILVRDGVLRDANKKPVTSVDAADYMTNELLVR